MKFSKHRTKKALHIGNIVLSIFILLLCSSCRNNNKIIIRYAHVGVQDEPQSVFAERVAAIVNERTEGRVEVQVYPNSQLGNVSKIVDGVKYGFIGMSQQDFSALSKFYYNFSVFNAPYIYRNIEHALLSTNPNTSPIMAEMNAALIKKSGIRIIGSFYRGARQLTTKFPVYSTKSLKGKKIRGVSFPIWMSMIKGMGAIPTPVEFSELTTALMTGLVAGQENPLSTIYASKIYEVQSHVEMTNHMLSCLCVFINEELWQKIGYEDQQIIMNAIEEVTRQITELITASDEKIRKELETGGLIFIDFSNGLDVEGFRSSVRKQIQTDFPEWEDYINEIQKLGNNNANDAF